MTVYWIMARCAKIGGVIVRKVGLVIHTIRTG
jgi:hypothetical protein